MPCSGLWGVVCSSNLLERVILNSPPAWTGYRIVHSVLSLFRSPSCTRDSYQNRESFPSSSRMVQESVHRVHDLMRSPYQIGERGRLHGVMKSVSPDCDEMISSLSFFGGGPFVCDISVSQLRIYFLCLFHRSKTSRAASTNRSRAVRDSLIVSCSSSNLWIRFSASSRFKLNLVSLFQARRLCDFSQSACPTIFMIRF